MLLFFNFILSSFCVVAAVDTNVERLFSDQISRAEGRHHPHSQHHHQHHDNSYCSSQDVRPSTDIDSFIEAEKTGVIDAVAEFNEMWDESKGGGGEEEGGHVTNEEGRNNGRGHSVADDSTGEGGAGEGGNNDQDRADYQLDDFNTRSTAWSAVPSCKQPCDEVGGEGEKEEEVKSEVHVRRKSQAVEAKVMVCRGKSGDVEEGEVSDSSEENRNKAACKEESRPLPEVWTI